MAKIISIGNTCLDIILRYTDRLPKWSTELFFDETKWRLGGQGANFAVACSLLGYPTYLVSNVGSDQAGQRLKTELKTVKFLNNRFLQISNQETGFTVSVLRSDGERLFLAFLGHQKSFSTKQDEERIISTVKDNDIVHLSGCYMLPRLNHELPRLFPKLKARGARISYDPGWPPLGFDNSERAHVRKLLRHMDFFEPNETELLGITSKTSVKSAVKEISRSFSGILALKRGAKGSVIFAGKNQITAKADKVHAIDSTGAGDAFDAGFLTGVIRMDSLQECARRGNAVGAFMISRDKSGVSRFPTKAELVKRLS